MREDKFWKLMAVCFLAAISYLAHGLHVGSDAQWPGVSNSAMASGVGTPGDTTEVVLTSSEDGRTIFMWQYNHSRPPRFLGKSITDK